MKFKKHLMLSALCLIGIVNATSFADNQDQTIVKNIQPHLAMSTGVVSPSQAEFEKYGYLVHAGQVQEKPSNGGETENEYFVKNHNYLSTYWTLNNLVANTHWNNKIHVVVTPIKKYLDRIVKLSLGEICILGSVKLSTGDTLFINDASEINLQLNENDLENQGIKVIHFGSNNPDMEQSHNHNRQVISDYLKSINAWSIETSDKCLSGYSTAKLNNATLHSNGFFRYLKNSHGEIIFSKNNSVTLEENLDLRDFQSSEDEIASSVYIPLQLELIEYNKILIKQRIEQSTDLDPKEKEDLIQKLEPTDFHQKIVDQYQSTKAPFDFDTWFVIRFVGNICSFSMESIKKILDYSIAFKDVPDDQQRQTRLCLEFKEFIEKTNPNLTLPEDLITTISAEDKNKYKEVINLNGSIWTFLSFINTGRDNRIEYTVVEDFLNNPELLLSIK